MFNASFPTVQMLLYYIPVPYMQSISLVSPQWSNSAVSLSCWTCTDSPNETTYSRISDLIPDVPGTIHIHVAALVKEHLLNGEHHVQKQGKADHKRQNWCQGKNSCKTEQHQSPTQCRV